MTDELIGRIYEDRYGNRFRVDRRLYKRNDPQYRAQNIDRPNSIDVISEKKLRALLWLQECKR